MVGDTSRRQLLSDVRPGRDGRAVLRRVLLAPLLVLGFAVGAAAGDKLVLKIEVTNPKKEPQKKLIKSNLPSGVRTNDVLNLAGLDLGYDIPGDVYFVHKEVTLDPGATLTFRVEINDIWVIPEEQLDELRRRAGELAAKLQKEDQPKALANELRKRIEADLDAIRSRQAENAISRGAKPIQHIRAFDENMRKLRVVKTDIGHLENLVLGSGQDPGGLRGEVRGVSKPDRELTVQAPSDRVVILRISIQNVSPTETQTNDVHHGLPPEIRVSDVVDAAGLDVGVDAARGTCFVSRKGVAIPPGERVTFDVKVRDRWNVNAPRIVFLRDSVTNLLDRLTDKDKHPSIVGLLKDLTTDLDRIATQAGPAAMGPEYVAFYRRQADSLDAIEQAINRIHALARPRDQLGLGTTRPTLKTTWVIIYIILGFLGIMSLLFFLRWMGRTSVDRLAGEAVSGEEKK